MSSAELKEQAVLAIAQGEARSYGVTLVWLLATMGLSNLLSSVVTDPVETYLLHLEQGVDPVAALQVFTGLSASLVLFLQLVLFLYGVVFRFGFDQYALRLLRPQEEKPGLDILIAGFSQAGRVLLTRLLAALLLTPAVVLVSLAASALGTAILWAAPGGALTFQVVTSAVSLLGAAVVLLYACRYAMVNFVMIHQDLGYMDAIRESARLMRGRTWEYVRLILSFLGWMLAAWMLGVGVPLLLDHVFPNVMEGLTGGLLLTLCALPGGLCLEPYLTCTRGAYYLRLRELDGRRGPAF